MKCDSFTPKITKSEINTRISELDHVLKMISDNGQISIEDIEHRKKILNQQVEKAPNDIFESILESHKVLCKIKKMGEKEAYGQNPAFYYGAAVSGEAGEMLNKMIKAFRNGGDATDKLFEAVHSELPDIIIYSFILAYVLDIDLTCLVSEKANTVIKRAMDGYYGGPLIRSKEA